MNIELCPESIALIVRKDLKVATGNLQQDLKRRKKGEQIAIFHTDAREDIAELQRHVDAFKLVLKYYGAN